LEELMDSRVEAVLETYERRIAEERNGPREEAPGGRDGGYDQRMRAVGPETGRFINIIASSLNRPTILEIGTSFGYSGIWLGAAARASDGRVITMEVHGYKSIYAKEMAEKAGLDDVIDFQIGDAVKLIERLECKIDFVLLDLWKDLYIPCLEVFYPKLSSGAVIVADNMLGRDPAVKEYGLAVRAKRGITSVLLPIGQGLEVSKYEP
jgi:predicted O-methyltransferase YrrM